MHQNAPAILLQRTDPAINLFRFYAISIERDLFGETLLVRRWGRIGTLGQARVERLASDAEARASLTRWLGAKVRRGYRVMDQTEG